MTVAVPGGDAVAADEGAADAVHVRCAKARHSIRCFEMKNILFGMVKLTLLSLLKYIDALNVGQKGFET